MDRKWGSVHDSVDARVMGVQFKHHGRERGEDVTPT